MVRGPTAVVVTLPLNVNPVPTKLIPARVFVLSAPKVVDPASCEMLAAVMAFVVLAIPELIVRMPMRVDPPTAPLKVMAPVPLVNERFWAPLIVLEIVISPGPAPPVLKEEAPVKVIAFAKERLELLVLTDPLRLTLPPPL